MAARTTIAERGRRHERLAGRCAIVVKHPAVPARRLPVGAGALAALEILDSFGQKSVLSFGTFQANAALDASHFQFKPPPGADVIRQ